MLHEKGEIKTLILYIFKELDAEVETYDAQESAVSTGEINILDYSDCYEELIKGGQIFSFIKDGKSYSGITRLGKETCAQLTNYIAPSVRERAVRKAIRHFDKIQTGVDYSSSIEKADNGYFVICRLIIHGKVRMETKLFFNEEKEAYNAYHTCDDRPDMVYNGLMAIVSGEIGYLNN